MRKAKRSKVKLRPAPKPTTGTWSGYLEEALNLGRPNDKALQARTLSKQEIQQQYTDAYVKRLLDKADEHGKTV